MSRIIAWIITIPFIPYYIVCTFYGVCKGMTEDEIFEKFYPFKKFRK